MARPQRFPSECCEFLTCGQPAPGRAGRCLFGSPSELRMKADTEQRLRCVIARSSGYSISEGNLHAYARSPFEHCLQPLFPLTQQSQAQDSPVGTRGVIAPQNLIRESDEEPKIYYSLYFFTFFHPFPCLSPISASERLCGRERG